MKTLKKGLSRSIRNKVILGLVAVFFISCFVVGVLSRNLILSRFEDIESHHLEVHIDGLKEAFILQADNLENKFVDWTIWDDAYNYVLTGNKKFENSTLSNESLFNAKVDLLGWRSNNGEWRWLKVADADRQSFKNLDPELFKYLNENHEIFSFAKMHRPLTGITTLPGLGPSFVSVQEIFKSNGHGPSVGSLIVARKINQKMLDQIGRLTHLKVTIRPFSLVGSQSLEDGGRIVKKSEQVITGLVWLKDVLNKSDLQASFEIKRDIYTAGQKSLKYMYLMVLVIGFFVCWSAWQMLKRILIDRVSLLNSHIEELSHVPEAKRSLPYMGFDELGRLAKTMDRYFNKIKTANIKADLEREKATHLAKLASLGEMSAGVAHEINNPLGVVVGNVYLLEKYKNEPEIFKAKIETIQKATTRIEKIVKGLKKISHSTEHIPKEIVSLDRVVTESLVFLEHRAKQNDVKILTDVSKSCKILADEIAIEQVVVNLINNAIDAVKSLNTRWVKVACYDLQNEILLQVIDSGNGISEQVEQKMFQPFFTTKNVGEGTGLGLSITKGILVQHGASIKINRNFSNTCFEISFKKVEVNQNNKGSQSNAA